MATSIANTKSVNRVEPPKICVVNDLPGIGEAEIGEMYLLVSDGHTDTLKIHIRVATGWLKTAALS